MGNVPVVPVGKRVHESHFILRAGIDSEMVLNRDYSGLILLCADPYIRLEHFPCSMNFIGVHKESSIARKLFNYTLNINYFTIPAE